MLKIRTESASDGMSGAIGVGPDYYNNQKMKLVIEGTASELAGLEISIPGQPVKSNVSYINASPDLLGGHNIGEARG